jgi:hypothetical protein
MADWLDIRVEGLDLALLPDAPLGGTGPIPHDDVRASLGALASGIAHVLQSTARRRPIPPLLVSGDWGAGKTSLLRLVERRLKLDGDVTLWFEAWRYEGQSPLLPTLVRHVWERAPKPKRSQAMLLSLMSAAIRLSIPLLTGPILGGQLAGLTGKTVATALTDSKLLSGLLGIDGDQPRPHPLDDLRQQLAELLDTAWPNKRVVVFIDDLDRCTPEGAVVLLDSLRALIVDSEDHRQDEERAQSRPLACRFVVALDRDVVSAAVSKKFAGISGYDGNRYLEKAFPYTFHISTPDAADAARLLDSLLRQMEAQSSGHRPPERAMEALRTVLRQPVFANPRLMTRCINRFTIAYAVDSRSAEADDRWSDFEPSRILAAWIAATARWPLMRRLMQHRDDAFWRDVVVPPVAGGPGTEPETKALLAEPGALAWMKTELSDDRRPALFREADDRLRRCGL